jgi:hypothetical protein
VPLLGLLTEAGNGPWTELTVPMSMRETENEVNLLVPGRGLFDPVLTAPPWSFAPAATDAGPDGDADADESADADELGEGR